MFYSGHFIILIDSIFGFLLVLLEEVLDLTSSFIYRNVHKMIWRVTAVPLQNMQAFQQGKIYYYTTRADCLNVTQEQFELITKQTMLS